MERARVRLRRRAELRGPLHALARGAVRLDRRRARISKDLLEKEFALRADVLIRTALELKVTNRMLGELEREWNQRMADGLEDE